jgi:hypothetical protein
VAIADIVPSSRASGKTSFYNKYFKPHDYVHVNQDTLKSRDKCLAVVRETITFGKTGCVVGESRLQSRFILAYPLSIVMLQTTRTGTQQLGVYTLPWPSNSRSPSDVSSLPPLINSRNTTTTIERGTPRMFPKRRYVQPSVPGHLPTHREPRIETFNPARDRFCRIQEFRSRAR